TNDGAIVDAEWWPLTMAGEREATFTKALARSAAAERRENRASTLDPNGPLALVSQVTRRNFASGGGYWSRALGCRPLHLACDVGHADITAMLLACGADPYLEVFLDGGVEGFWDWTPLQLARGQPHEQPHHAVVKILDAHLQQHPQSDQSKDWQQRRRSRVPF